MSRVRRTLGWLGVLVSLSVLCVAVAWFDYMRFLQGPVDEETERNVVIGEGMSGSAIVEMLTAEGLIDSPTYLRFYLWRSGKGRALQPGSYRIAAGTSVSELIDLLVDGGDSNTVTLWVPPGVNLWELAERLHELGLADRKIFLQRATDPKYAAELGIPARSLEGYLLPGTYAFERGVAVDAIIAQLHERFLATWVGIVQAHPEAMADARTRLKMGDHELITLASVVGKEAMVDAERSVIARVFFNRLARRMPLQSDPTCIYPPQSLGEKPSPSRCRDKSSVYSTYVIDGLPQGPIASVGPASLLAVLQPWSGPQADKLLYFVARNDGSWRHYFSASLAEHEAAIAYFLKKSTTKAPSATRQP